jgi:Fur family peroxide stress response transcriptional regulator
LAATHQRQVIYEAIVATPGHHSAEAVYAEVRRRTPAISLATVYKNLRLFVEHGLLREVSPHASTLLVNRIITWSAHAAKLCRILKVTSST